MELSGENFKWISSSSTSTIDSLEVDALTLEPKSVLFSKLPSSFFFEEWINSTKLAPKPRLIKLNYHSLNKMTEI